MFFNILSSGSKGNSTIIFCKSATLLLDFGISKKRVNDALKKQNKSFEDLDAIFITHTHSDHASDVFNAPLDKIYAPQPKLPKIEQILSGEHLVKAYQTIYVNNVKVTSVPLSHDCPNTMGYIIEEDGEKLSYITDTGFVPEKDFQYIVNSTYFIFESNHDATMLFNSKRPDYLIKRIISDTGHLNNYDSAYYLTQLIGKNTKEVVLFHLSDECNTPTLAMDTFYEVFKTQRGEIPQVILKCASDKKETLGGELE